MKLLICAATLPELQTFSMKAAGLELCETSPFAQVGEQAFLLTGVGIPPTLANLFTLLPSLHPERILDIGIAGAYPNSGLQIGDVVMGTSEVYGDVGFELPEPPYFQTIADSRFAGSLYAEPFPLERFEEWITPTLYWGRGVTVNTCTGSERIGLLRESGFQASFETMEGAAVAQVARQFGIPVCEIRAISNIASTRDMRFENIRHALINLKSHFQACREQR
ncbi:MAG: hypothetical protein NT023_22385 [Armatimonadetes bacterium]|nr:hypothetical protein [Armatimonadota bacterium]